MLTKIVSVVNEGQRKFKFAASFLTSLGFSTIFNDKV